MFLSKYINIFLILKRNFHSHCVALTCFNFFESSKVYFPCFCDINKEIKLKLHSMLLVSDKQHNSPRARSVGEGLPGFNFQWYFCI